MSRTVTVGFDGSPGSRGAAEWAAREAVPPGWRPPLPGGETRGHRSERIPREAAAGSAAAPSPSTPDP